MDFLIDLANFQFKLQWITVYKHLHTCLLVHKCITLCGHASIYVGGWDDQRLHMIASIENDNFPKCLCQFAHLAEIGSCRHLVTHQHLIVSRRCVCVVISTSFALPWCPMTLRTFSYLLPMYIFSCEFPLQVIFQLLSCLSLIFRGLMYSQPSLGIIQYIFFFFTLTTCFPNRLWFFSALTFYKIFLYGS